MRLAVSSNEAAVQEAASPDSEKTDRAPALAQGSEESLAPPSAWRDYLPQLLNSFLLCLTASIRPL